MTYAIVKLGGKQYRVQEGEQLLVDRLAVEESKTFHPEVLLVGRRRQGRAVAEGHPGHGQGRRPRARQEDRIGKYKRRTGYRRQNGFRARLSRVEIQTIGKKATRELDGEGGGGDGGERRDAQAEGGRQPRAASAAKPKPTKKAE